MENNPYSSPVNHPQTGLEFGNSNTVSVAVIEQLAATKPWVRLMSVITFIGAAFMLLGAAGMLLVGGMGAMSRKPSAAVLSGAMGFGIAAIYATLALVYIFPGVKLWKYASAIGSLMHSGTEVDLVAALNQQRSFWKFVGIIVLAIIVLYVFIIIAFVLFGSLAAAKLKGGI